MRSKYSNAKYPIEFRGKKYFIDLFPKKPSSAEFRKSGITPTMSPSMVDFLIRLADKYRCTAYEKNQNEWNSISGFTVKYDDGDVSMVKINKIDPDKQIYLLNVYGNSSACEIQTIVSIENDFSDYIILENPKFRQGLLQHQNTISAGAIVAATLLGLKIFINISGFKAYDELTDHICNEPEVIVLNHFGVPIV